MEAFSAFQAAYGGEVKNFDVSITKPEIGGDVRTLVAFGGRAALVAYPPEPDLVYCMSPGVFVKSQARKGKTVKISMVPAFGEIFLRIRQIQPTIKRLRIFWTAPEFGGYIGKFKAQGEALGLEISAVEVGGGGELPAVLRESGGAMDAFWVPPDPLLLTPENMMILREFSWANSVPFYGSSKGVTRAGAIASVGMSFRDIGEAAAKAALGLAAGEILPPVIFPEKLEITLNATAAKKCGLTFPRDILREAGEPLP